ncbi:Pre-mRNA-splicing factor SPF27 [Aphelenchoides bicaudatus]|nr:Pre-mRNA-splicing factor SPF27 [Aphelenchoides bicaudatus]
MSLAITYGKPDDFILDALPYIDDAEYDETHRKFAMQLIEEEQRDMEKLNMSRYEIPAPQPNTPQASDRNAWVQSIKNCESQLENQNLRRLNLELMLEYAPEAYLKMNEFLQKEATQQEQGVYQLRSKLFELHSRRKRRQEETGEKLIQMGSQWIGLVNKNIKLNQAIQDMRTEINAAKKRRDIDAFDSGNVARIS